MSAKSIFKNPLQFLGLEETQKIPEEKEHSGGRSSGASATSSSSGVFRVPPPPDMDNILSPVPPDACIRDIPTVHDVDTSPLSSDSDETSSTTSDAESVNEVKPISPSKLAEDVADLRQREVFLSVREKALVKKEEAFKQIEQVTTARLELINYVQSSLAQFSQAGGQFINSLMASSHQVVTTPEATQPPQQVLPIVQPPTPEARKAEKEKRHRERKEERKRAKLNKN